MKRIKIIGFLVFVFCFGSMWSQNFSEDMEKVNKAFLDLKTYELRMTVNSESKEGNKDQMTVIVKRKEKNFCQITDYYEYIQNKNYSVMLLPMSKEINYTIMKPVVKDTVFKNSWNIQYQSMLDSTIANYDSVAYLGNKGGTKKYRIYNCDAIIPFSDIYISTSTFLLKKLEYEYDEKYNVTAQKISIIYNFNINPSFTASTFSEGNYIRNEHGKIIPSQKYSSYSIYKTDQK